ncbi:MAG: hypothetical protein WC371_04120, partial [Parachlamydiales bacterium]
ENSLAEFLGKIKAFVATGNILVGLFFYRRSIKRIGVTNMLLVPPLVFTFLYSEWLIQETLLIAILGVISVDGVLFTIEDNNFNLLVKAAPLKLRGALRFINDSFFEPVGLFFSSLFLIFLQSRHIWLGFSLALVFLIVSFVLRHFYPRSILLNLQENSIHFERRIKDWLRRLSRKEQKEIQEDILEALKSPSEKMQLLAFQTLIGSQDKKNLAKLLFYAGRFSEEGKLAVLEQLDFCQFSNDPSIIETIGRWLEENPSEKLQKRAQLYLAKRGFLHPEKVADLLDSGDLGDKAIAITTFKHSKAQQTPENIALNKTIAKKEIDLLLKSDSEENKILGLQLISEDSPDGLEKTIKFLESGSAQVAAAAAAALLKFSSKSLSPFALKIIERMGEVSDSRFRLCCLEALGIISDSSTIKEIIKESIFFRPAERRLAETVILKMGLKTVPVLIALIKDLKLHDRCRILAGKILGRIALPQLQANLREIIDLEIRRAYFYLYFGHTIQKEYPLYDLKLLENALLTGFQSIVSFIIHLLGAAGSLEEGDLLVLSLHSKNTKAQADAIETLEKNCDSHIFNRIQPLIDDWPIEEKLKIYEKNYAVSTRLSLTELLNTLENSASLFDRTIASSLKAKFRMPKWRESLREQIKSSDGPLHQYAYELLKQ